ncbi:MULTISPECIES: hypothetical protein [unclassified Legionella]|uniref:hypothetical protein n=1 Tax=unclassified Legionella TaxID=2622702 RepID=UPI001E543FB5|nr:hypothetical protein [Legionella sp. 31fI33]MCC5013974.1 hypothetical protein [Legionella sp. 31fI33]
MKLDNTAISLVLKRFTHYWCVGAICSTFTLISGFFIWSLLIVSLSSLLLSIEDLTTYKRMAYYPPTFTRLYLSICLIAAVLTAIVNFLMYSYLNS